MQKEMENFILSRSAGQGMHDELHVVNEAKGGHDSAVYTHSNEVGDEGSGSKHASEKGSKKKRGKTAGNTKAAAAESVPDNLENLPMKAKKNQRKSKEANFSQVSEKKSSGKKGSEKSKEDNLNVPSEEWIMEKILMLIPDFEGQGMTCKCLLLHPFSLRIRYLFHILTLDSAV